MRRAKTQTPVLVSETIGASDFKARCLELLDRVHAHGGEIVVTKHGEPVARVISVQAGSTSLRGAWRDRGVVHGDIVHGDWTEEWDAAAR